MFLLACDLILTFFALMDGFRYISTGAPEWYNSTSQIVIIFLMYGAPALIFLSAGMYIGAKASKGGVTQGVRFGLMWGTILCLALQVMYAVLLLGNVYQINTKFLRMWSQSSIAVLFICSGVVVLSATGGGLGQWYRSKK